MASATPMSRSGAALNLSSSVSSRSKAAAPGVQAPPTTAPVLDYSCLFTHDLKRKQKRWQDGRLKFHTFNKRVMVYDERANFIGDTHWCEDYDFDEGEEFQLERGCVIVQVAECVGSKEQDLTELLEKRYKDKEERQARAAAAPPLRNGQLTSRPSPAAQPHRQRPLNDLTTTPRGNRLGRAVVPTESPFDQRMQQQAQVNDSENSRPAKRRKPDVSPPSKSGYAQNLFGTVLSLSPWTSSGQLTQPRRIQIPAQAPVNPPPRPAATSLQSLPRAPPSLANRAQRPVLVQSGREERNRSNLVLELDSPPASPPLESRDTIAAAPSRYPAEASRSTDKPTSSVRRNSADGDTLTSDETHSNPSRLQLRAQQNARSVHDEVNQGTVITTSRSAPRDYPTNGRETPAAKEKQTSKRKEHRKTSPPADPQPLTTNGSRKSLSGSRRRHGPSTTSVVADDPDLENRSRLVSRSKPSRKRGLLMVADKTTKKRQKVDGEPFSGETSNALPEVIDLGLMDDVAHGSDGTATSNSLEAKSRMPPSKATRPKKSKRQAPAASLSPEQSPDRCQTSKKRTKPRNIVVDDDPFEDDERLDHCPGEASCAMTDAEQTNDAANSQTRSERPARRRRPKRNAVSEEEEEDSEVLGASTKSVARPRRKPPLDSGHHVIPSGMRLASLGRRSVKSKEILGFATDAGAASFSGGWEAFRSVEATVEPAPSADQDGAGLDEMRRLSESASSVSASNAKRVDDLLRDDVSRSCMGAEGDQMRVEPARDQEVSEILGSSKTPPEDQEVPLDSGSKEATHVNQHPQPPTEPATRHQDQPYARKETSDDENRDTTTAPQAPQAEKSTSDLVRNGGSPSLVSEEPALGMEKTTHGTSVETAKPTAQQSEKFPPQRAQSAQSAQSGNESGGGEQPHSAAPSAAAAALHHSQPSTGLEPAQHHHQQQPPAPTKLVNPATRGRKAAQKSDAAGKVPQSVVPAVPPGAAAAVGRPPDRKVGAPALAPRREEQGEGGSGSGSGGGGSGSDGTGTRVESVGASTTNLPGFSRAGGGPWITGVYVSLAYET